MNLNHNIPEAGKFKKVIGEKNTDLYIIRNGRGSVAAVSNYGARWISLILPVNGGTDVIAGFNNVDDYIGPADAYYGAVVGRYANRIAAGKFDLNGKEFTLDINNPPNHLHGGPEAFHAKVWDVISHTDDSIEMKLFSPHGEEGYPGDVAMNVVYQLNNDNEMKISFKATASEDTILNVTNHAYFNLNGEGTGNILAHMLQIDADHYTPVNEYLIPTGEIVPVKNTPFDFTTEKMIGTDINVEHDQIKFGGGYDHNFVLNAFSGFRKVAVAKGDMSNISMEVFTDQPGMQLYTGNFMPGSNAFKHGGYDTPRSAFCLETQHFPDSPNKPEFPTVMVKQGEIYFTETAYRFILP